MLSTPYELKPRLRRRLSGADLSAAPKARGTPPPVHLVALVPLVWVMGIVLMWLTSMLAAESLTFGVSVVVVAVTAAFLWKLVIRRYERSILLRWLLAGLVGKITISYVLWVTFVMGPGPDCEGKDFVNSPMSADFISAIGAVKSVALYWQEHGFKLPLPEGYYLTTNHRVPVYIMALPLRYAVDYPEVAISWNAFYSLVTGTAVLGISCFTNLSRRLRALAFYATFMAPFTWLTGGLYKDILLQAILCTFVLALLSLRRYRGIAMLIIPAGAELLYQFRTPYFLAGLCAGAYAIFGMDRHRHRAVIGSTVMAAILIIGAQTGFMKKYYSDIRDTYSTNAPGTQPLSFGRSDVTAPLKRAAVGLLTPFPWDLTFQEPRVYHTRIADHSQVILSLALLTIVIPLCIREFPAVMPPVATITALTFMVIGMSGPFIHHGYVHVASVLLLPQGLSLGSKTLVRRLISCLLVLIGLNAIWLLGGRLLWSGQM